MSLNEPIFEIQVLPDGDIAYAETPEGAFLAYITLLKENNIWGARARVTNLVTEKIVWEGSKLF